MTKRIYGQAHTKASFFLRTLASTHVLGRKSCVLRRKFEAYAMGLAVNPVASRVLGRKFLLAQPRPNRYLQQNQQLMTYGQAHGWQLACFQ